MEVTLTNPPPSLLDLRYVYEKPPEQYEPENLLALRKILREKPLDFMELLSRLESKWSSQEEAALKLKEAEAHQRPRQEENDRLQKQVAALAEENRVLRLEPAERVVERDEGKELALELLRQLGA